MPPLNLQPDIMLRSFAADDMNAILHLNDKSESLLSAMDTRRFLNLQSLCKITWVLERNGEIIAFIMGFTSNAHYDSTNYQWFDARFKDFLYIDRIVVAEEARSLGLASYLYQELTRWATSLGFKWLAAEVDSLPVNHISMAFHEKQGFISVAHRLYGPENKQVALLIKPLENPKMTINSSTTPSGLQ